MPEPAHSPPSKATAKQEGNDRPSASGGHSVSLAEAPPDLPELARRHSALRARFLEVVGQMEQTSAAMCESGRPPDFRLVQALGDCHRAFVRLRHEVLQRAAIGNRKIRSTERLATLSDLEAFLESLDEPVSLAEVVSAGPPARPMDATEDVPPPVVETIVAPPADRPIAAPPDHFGPAVGPDPPPADGPMRAAALAVLEKSLRLSLVDGSDLPALADFHDRARSLREAISSSPPGELPSEAGPLAAGIHPLARLANAVEGKEDLSDADWADVHVMVTETFGRPMAVALARQRLVVRPAEEK